MQLILAIDSDPRRSEQLASLVRARLQVDLVQATSAGEGLHALRDRVPDLILTSPLLSPFDDGVLDEYLRDLGSAATHVQTVRIPMLSSGPRKNSAAKRLFSLGRKKTQTSSAAPDGCDPKVFADEIAHYLTRSLEGRAASTKPAPATRSIEPEPVTQVVDEWNAPEALVQEFRETTPEPAPVYEDTHVPGSILDLRTPIVHAPAPPPSRRTWNRNHSRLSSPSRCRTSSPSRCCLSSPRRSLTYGRSQSRTRNRSRSRISGRRRLSLRHRTLRPR
jgi:hypothetical protein